MFRQIATAALALASAFVMAGTITVTSPRTGDFLGRNNQLRFTITGSNAQVRVSAAITNVSNPLITFSTQRDFDPNVDGEISGNLDLNFDRSTPEGLYNIVVNVVEPGNPYNVVNINSVNIDVVEPKFLDSNPINGAFVRGNVPIALSIEEGNIDEWRVQVNGNDIPNNVGSSNNVNVVWATDGIERDGSQSVNIRVEDKANNQANKSINVTLDRVAPSIQIISPTGTPLRPNASVLVAVEITDQFNGSVTPQAIDVVARRMDDTIIQRVARSSSRNNGSILSWTGRIRRTNNFPRQFKIVATAVDRAGNPAVQQQVVVNLR